jgi:hypothetical protein
MSEDPAFYDRALRRLDSTALVLAGTAIFGMFTVDGWRGALGAAAGAAFSLASLHRWKRIAGALGAQSKTRLRLRMLAGYAVLGASLFVIIRYFGVSPRSVIAGLFVSMAAVIVEIVYELLTGIKQ